MNNNIRFDSSIEFVNDFIVKNIELSGKVLDLGSGQGYLVSQLVCNGVDAYGVDISPISVKYANQRNIGRFFEGDILKIPFNDGVFNFVTCIHCLEYLSEDEIILAIKEIYRVCLKNVFIKVSICDPSSDFSLTLKNRAWWESLFFNNGFRKHSVYYNLNDYESLEYDRNEICFVLSKIQSNILTLYPLTMLMEERALHMDMLRETGRRSDGHVFRYHFATAYIKPNDRVLDLACGMGYGSYVLGENSLCSKVTGVDIHVEGLEYANNMYGSEKTSFHLGNAEDLNFIASNSFDIVCSFETLEHLPNPELLLQELYRVIAPGGRLIISVPNDWSDDSGRDPNPYHYNVYTWQSFIEQVSNLFIVDECFDQIAGGGFKLFTSNRLFRKHELLSADSEWAIIVAIKPFLSELRNNYIETVYPKTNQPLYLLEFKKYYDNPWIVHNLVEVSFRVKNNEVLNMLCYEVLKKSMIASPDYGAALCVLGYSILSSQQCIMIKVIEFIDTINKYLIVDSDNPHVFRWKVSLTYLLGKLYLKIGEFENAIIYFKNCLNLDYTNFAVILGSKHIQSAREIAFIYLKQNKIDDANNYLKKAINVFVDIIKSNTINIIGDERHPLTCNYFDLMSIVDDGMHSLLLSSLIDKKQMYSTKFLNLLSDGFYRSNSSTLDVSNIVYKKLQNEHWDLQLYSDKLLSEQHQLVLNLDIHKAELLRVSKERDDLYLIAEERLRLENQLVLNLDIHKAELLRVSKERDDLYVIVQKCNKSIVFNLKKIINKCIGRG